MFLKSSQFIRVADIAIEDRQRLQMNEEDLQRLAASIEARGGLIHPILVKKTPDEAKPFRLIAGGRRLAAHMILGREEIEARFNKTDDPNELKILELEENVHRSDLSWQEQMQAVKELHEAFVALDPEWTHEKTGEACNLSQGHVTKYLGIAAKAEKDPTILAAATLGQANTAVKRERARGLEQVKNDLFMKPEEREAKAKSIITPEVLCGDFIDWSGEVRGERFDVIHCDFPYGIKLQNSGQMSHASGSYLDDPDVYWALLDAFVKNYGNFAKPCSHIMFWFSMKFYERTVKLLGSIPEANVWPNVLVWHKSDGAGIVADATRYPRNTHEVALLVSVGDRRIVKPVASSVAQPLDKDRGHPSRKPPSVLAHFLPMLVEKGNRLLDPTCGSGSSLQVAKSLGATVLGIEKDEKFANAIRL